MLVFLHEKNVAASGEVAQRMRKAKTTFAEKDTSEGLIGCFYRPSLDDNYAVIHSNNKLAHRYPLMNRFQGSARAPDYSHEV